MTGRLCSGRNSEMGTAFPLWVKGIIRAGSLLGADGYSPTSLKADSPSLGAGDNDSNVAHASFMAFC